MILGPSIDLHHWVPKSEGGSSATPLDRVCHRMLHRLFDEKTLAREFATPEACLSHHEIQKFVKWVRKKPAGYIDWPKRPRR